MIFRSIKWSLQLWHGIILLLVLAGFGYTAYELQHTRELRRVDLQIQDRLTTIFTPRQQRGGLEGGRRQNPPERGDAPPTSRRREGNFQSEDAVTNQPRGPFRARLEERFREGRLPDELPPNFASGEFGDDPHVYHVIWRREQRIGTRNVPTDLVRPQPGDPPGARTRDHYREYVRFTPRGDVIVVGRSIASELTELRNFSLILLGTGAGILLLGLAGGWIVATRAMAPIESITRTALKISNGDLTQRIPQEDTENELGHLVSVLNSTFTRLESAFAEQTRFTTDVSHELRTPVSVIVSQTQMTLARERSPAEYRETLQACQRAAQRMRGLIESLMQLARLDAGQEHFRREPFDLASVAHETVNLLQSLASERSLNLIPQLAPAAAFGDSERIGQVVLNLITNAIHYTPPGGSIRVETSTENKFAILRVIDSGMGIPPEDLPRIFDRFYRVEKSRSREKGGSGLGLAISKAIIAAHSGSVEVSSEVGRGTTFLVRLPIQT
jgi:heavy metal sensor kinase